MSEEADSIQIPGYRIVSEVGRGGMATTYLAVQENFGRQVILKILTPSVAADASFAARFLREARIVGQLAHPNIVTVYDVGRSGEHYFLAMEYLSGGDLRHRIRSGLTPLEALQTTREIALALEYAHAQGFIHRDVKPDNILYRAGGNVVLTDFGIARTIDDSGELTQVQMVIGSPRYMSPEQALGEPLDQRTDLYSLGLVMYEMLTGQPPHEGESGLTILGEKSRQSALCLPATLAQVQPLLDKLLALDPEARPVNSREVITALDSLIDHFSPQMPGETDSDATRMMAGQGKRVSGGEYRWKIASPTFWKSIQLKTTVTVTALAGVLIAGTVYVGIVTGPGSGPRSTDNAGSVADTPGRTVDPMPELPATDTRRLTDRAAAVTPRVEVDHISEEKPDAEPRPSRPLTSELVEPAQEVPPSRLPSAARERVPEPADDLLAPGVYYVLEGTGFDEKILGGTVTSYPGPTAMEGTIGMTLRTSSGQHVYQITTRIEGDRLYGTVEGSTDAAYTGTTFVATVSARGNHYIWTDDAGRRMILEPD